MFPVSWYNLVTSVSCFTKQYNVVNPYWKLKFTPREICISCSFVSCNYRDCLFAKDVYKIKNIHVYNFFSLTVTNMLVKIQFRLIPFLEKLIFQSKYILKFVHMHFLCIFYSCSMHLNQTTRNFQFCRELTSIWKFVFCLHFSFVFVFVIKYCRLCVGSTNLFQKKKYHLFFRTNIPHNTQILIIFN